MLVYAALVDPRILVAEVLQHLNDMLLLHGGFPVFLFVPTSITETMPMSANPIIILRWSTAVLAASIYARC